MNKETLENLTEKFNRFRNPECRAEVVEKKDDEIKVKFTGTSAHFSCCFDEHFIDYKYMLKDFLKIDFKLEKVERISDEEFVVKYKKGGKQNGIKGVDGSNE